MFAGVTGRSEKELTQGLVGSVEVHRVWAGGTHFPRFGS